MLVRNRLAAKFNCTTDPAASISFIKLASKYVTHTWPTKEHNYLKTSKKPCDDSVFDINLYKF